MQWIPVFKILKNTLSKSKVRRNFQKSVKFVAKDSDQSHNFNNNPWKLDAGIDTAAINRPRIVNWDFFICFMLFPYGRNQKQKDSHIFYWNGFL